MSKIKKLIAEAERCELYLCTVPGFIAAARAEHEANLAEIATLKQPARDIYKVIINPRQPGKFTEYLKWCSANVEKWPAWKRKALGQTILGETDATKDKRIKELEAVCREMVKYQEFKDWDCLMEYEDAHKKAFDTMKKVLEQPEDK